MTKKVLNQKDALAVNNRPDFGRPSLSGEHEFVQQGYVMNDRKVAVKVSKSVVIDPKKEMRKYRVSDFCLQNIIAAGAVDNLKECNMQYGTLKCAEIADRVMDSIENFENNNVKNTDE